MKKVESMSLEAKSHEVTNASGLKSDLETRNCENDKQRESGSLLPPLLSPAAESHDYSDEKKSEMEGSSLHSERTEAQEASREADVKKDPMISAETQLKNLAISSTTPNPDPRANLQDADPDKLRPAEAIPHDYLDPTPKTPRQEVSPSRKAREDLKLTGDGDTDSEIQSIMDQFGKNDEIVGEDGQWTTDETQLSAPLQHPPRRSSLIPVEALDRRQELKDSSLDATNEKTHKVPQEAVRPSRHSSLPQATRLNLTHDPAPPSPTSPLSLPKLPPPAPDPESDQPFDFHRFLEQLRDKSADPVAKYLRSFLIEFGRKQWMVHEQVKLINDFLTFITNKMGRCAVWREVSDAEFENAKEGMEKLVMNRLYTQTFSPAIPPPTPTPTPKGKRRLVEKSLEPGRRGQHQEDIERDEILGQKIRIYGWVQEDHLDIPRVGDNGRRFLLLAQQELLKIKSYRAPRDKIICVLNCCKVIFGILRNTKSSDTSADSFVPLLIYVVLHANPEHLVSNVQYILRFRSQEKLGGEAGYYLSSLMGAIQFIENLDRTNLTVSDQEFETSVEAAVSIIAEKHREKTPLTAPQKRQPAKGPTASHLSEKSSPSMPEVIPRNSIDAEYSSPHKTNAMREGPGEAGKREIEDNTAVGGLLRTIQRPLTSIGRMFTDDPGPGLNSHTRLPPGSQSPTRLSPALFQPPRRSEDANGTTERPSMRSAKEPATVSKTSDLDGDSAGKLSAEDAASRQASAEAAEAQRLQRAEHQNIVEFVSVLPSRHAFS